MSDGVDRGQLEAIVRTMLRQALRPGIDARTGSRGHPLRQLMVSLGFLGALFTRNAGRSDGLETYWILLFGATLVLTMLHVAPDPFEIRQRNAEIIQSRPVGVATLVGAQTALRVLLATLIATCFSALPLVAARYVFGAPWLQLLGGYLLLVAGSFTAVVLWLLAVLLLAGFVPLERIRSINQLALLALVLGVSFGSLFAGQGPLAGRLSLGPQPWIAVLPSTWFARALTADFDRLGIAQRCGALSLFAAAVVIPLSTRGWDGAYARLVEGELRSRERAVTPPRDVRLLNWLSRLPWIGRRVAPPQVLGVASVVLTLLAREETSRVKMLVPRVVAAGFFLFGLTDQGGAIAVAMLGYFGIASILQGLEVVRQSPDFPASWPFFVAPVEMRHLAAGMRRAISVRLFSWHFTLMAVALFMRNPPLQAALLVAAYVVAARLTFATALAVSPALPLSQEQRASQSLAGFVASFFVNVGLAVAYGIVLVLVSLLGLWGAVIAAGGAAVLLVLAVALETLAARRMAALALAA